MRPHVNMSTLVRACVRNWSLRLLWDLNSRKIQTKNRSVSENAVTGIWGSCRLLVMGFCTHLYTWEETDTVRVVFAHENNTMSPA